MPRKAKASALRSHSTNPPRMTTADLPRIREAIVAYREEIKRCLEGHGAVWGDEESDALARLDHALGQPRNDNNWPHNLRGADLTVALRKALANFGEAAPRFQTAIDRTIFTDTLEELLAQIDSAGVVNTGDVSVDDEDIAILMVLNDAHPKRLIQTGIVAGTGLLRHPVCPRTIIVRLRKLRSDGLINRPNGERGGEQITPKGREVLSQLSSAKK